MSLIHPSWWVIGAGVSAALHIGKLPPSIPVLQQALDMSLVQAGFLLSTVQVAGMSLGLLIGLGADAMGLRRTVLMGLLTLAVASGLGGFAHHFAALLGLRALEGLGFLLVVMPAPALIRRTLQEHQLSARMGWWGAYMPTGSGLALLLGPVVLSLAGWQVWWWLLGAVTLLATLAVWRSVPPDPRGSVRTPAPGQPAVTSAGWIARLQRTLQSPGPWLVSLTFAVYASQWMAVIGFLPTIYAQAGVSSTLAGAMTACVAWVNVLGNVASGRLLGRGWRAERLLQIGFACMAVGAWLAFWQAGDVLSFWSVAEGAGASAVGGVEGASKQFPLWLRFAGVVLFSMVGGLIPGTLFSLALRLTPAAGTVSATVGFMQQWSSLGQFLGPPTVAWLAARVGHWNLTWTVTVALCLMGALFAQWISGLLRALQDVEVKLEGT